MNGVVAQVLTYLGGASFLGLIIKAITDRRRLRAEAGKIGADAAEVLARASTKFADEVREAAREDNSALRQELAETRGELAGNRAEMAALRRHMAVLEAMLRRYLPPDVAVPDFVWPPPIANGR